MGFAGLYLPSSQPPAQSSDETTARLATDKAKLLSPSGAIAIPIAFVGPAEAKASFLDVIASKKTICEDHDVVAGGSATTPSRGIFSADAEDDGK
jgi:hypothetical protein